jgi:hypothetical protein
MSGEGVVQLIQSPTYKATLILHGGPQPGVHHMDVIEFDGRLWLVPEWKDYRESGHTMPARMVSLENIPHSAHLQTKGTQVTVSFPLPWDVFDGSITSDDDRTYVILEAPNIAMTIRPN